MIYSKYEESYKEYVRAIQGRNLVLFGAGNNCRKILSTYYIHGEVAEIWDNDRNKSGKNVYGYTIKTPPESISDSEADRYVVLVAIENDIITMSIMEQLEVLGLKHVFHSSVLGFANLRDRYNSDFSYNFHEMNTYRLVSEHEDQISRVFHLLSDEKSRQVYRTIIENKKYNMNNYTDICDDPYDHYFSDDVFKYEEEEVFVDGGAFLGEDTIRLGHKIGKGKIKRAYCFEPDMSNYLGCIRNLNKYFETSTGEFVEDRYESERITVCRAGMWDSADELAFASKGTQSSSLAQIDKTVSEDSILTMRLDDVVKLGDRVTLIKLDVEGAEIPAIRGSERTIKRDKPKLAISIYHKTEDLWEIPLLIHDKVAGYKFFVRHHTGGVWDSILYCFVDE